MGSYAPGNALSLLTTIRNDYRDYEQNIISSLSMVFHKAIRAYCFNPSPLVSSARPNRVSTAHAYSSLVTSHREALTFTGHWPQSIAWYRALMYQRWFSNSEGLHTC